MRYLRSSKCVFSQVPLSMARHNELGSFHSIEHSWKAEKSFDVFTDVVFSSTG